MQETFDYTQRRFRPPRLTPPITVALIRFADDRDVPDVPFGTPANGGRGEPGHQTDVRVQVGGIQVDATGNEPPGLPSRSRAILKHALVSSGSFRVVERERILDIIREQLFSKTQYTDPGTGAEAGKIIGARYLIEGSIGRNQDRTLKGVIDDPWSYRNGVPPPLPEQVLSCDSHIQRGRLRALHRAALRQFQEDQLRAANHISVYLSLYDVKTGEIAVDAFGLGGDSTEAIEDAVQELIRKSASLVDSND